MLIDRPRGGRPRTNLTPNEHADFDRRYAVVLLPERGAALVFNNTTGDPLTFSEFRKQFGARGSLWLESPQRPTYFNLAHYRLLHPLAGQHTEQEHAR